MYRVQLSAAEQAELKRRARDPRLKPRTRERLEMVRLCSAGFSIPAIAPLLSVSEQRVRHWIKRFLTGGFDALPDQPHPGQRSACTPAIITAVRQELEKSDRTWTAQQVADWVAAQLGVRLSSEHWSDLLRRARLSYKRTARSLKHKQDAAEMERRKEELLALEKKGESKRSICITSTKLDLP